MKKNKDFHSDLRQPPLAAKQRIVRAAVKDQGPLA
jgi:hypothetical protein